MQVAEQLNAGLAGRYRIEREIGSGGMAVVYQAHDLRHDRLVALKVLNPDLGAILGVTRFLEEIRVTANLQHPNLLPLFDSGEVDGLLFYVMPYVDGESLRARLQRDIQLSIDDAVHLGASIAGALDYAHAHGVIHRDLKPENILLQRGEPMLADFGIALAVKRAAGERITESGISLGTPSYMSPEQATGDRVIDGRTDVYSLAAILYEMLTGDPPHRGHSSQSIIARVITEPVPSVRIARPNVPGHVADAIARGLEKVPADRWPTAGAFADALTGGSRIRAAQVPTLTFAEPWRVRQRAFFFAAGLLFGVSLASLGLWLRTPPLAPLTWHILALPESLPPFGSVNITNLFFDRTLALASDGSALAYVADPAQVLVVRRLEDPVPHVLAHTEGAGCPSFSPDGRWLVFAVGDRLLKISLGGGLPVVLVDSTAGCGVWTDRNEVIFNSHRGIERVSSDGGASEIIAHVDARKGISTMEPTQALPGGLAILMNLSPTRSPYDYQLGLVSLSDGKISRLTEPESDGEPRLNANYSAGYIVYQHGKLIVSAPFSLQSLKLVGPEVPILRDTVYNIVTSFDGHAAYRSVAPSTLSLVAAGVDGHSHPLSGIAGQLPSRPTVIDTAHYAWPRLSPSGRIVALELSTGLRSWDVGTYDLTTHSFSRLTTNFSGIRPLAWSSDGQRLFYFRLDTPTVTAPRHLVSQAWDGSSPATELFNVPANTHSVTFGPPHTYAIVALSGAQQNPLLLVPLDTPSAMRPLLSAQSTDREPRISPDGKLLAYVGSETHREEIYVRPLPFGRRIQVSTTGGTEPVWSRDGKSLFYRGAGYFMRAAIATTPAPRVARRDSLFKDVYVGRDVANYDIFPNGRELLVIRSTDARIQIGVVQNWPALLRQRTIH